MPEITIIIRGIEKEDDLRAARRGAARGVVKELGTMGICDRSIPGCAGRAGSWDCGNCAIDNFIKFED